MTTLLLWSASFLILSGAVFAIIGAIGLVRFPYYFVRLHPVSIIDSLAIPLIILGCAALSGISLVTLKLLLLLLFLMITGPTACHALAQTAFLAEREENEPNSNLKPPAPKAD